MGGFFRSCVETYRELAGNDARPLGKVDTPFCGDDLGTQPGEPPETGGRLGHIAARVLMKVLYGAQMCRFDLLRAVGNLATRISKWTLGCDKALHRLMSYINGTIGIHSNGVCLGKS